MTTDYDPTAPTLHELATMVAATHAELVTARDAAREANHRVRVLAEQLARLVAEYDTLAKAPLP